MRSINARVSYLTHAELPPHSTILVDRHTTAESAKSQVHRKGIFDQAVFSPLLLSHHQLP